MSGTTRHDLSPTRPDERTWSTWNIAALWIGMAVCIPTYTLAAGMIDAGMAWWQAVLTVALGNIIVLVPMVLNGHAGVKHGIPFPVLMRSSFGYAGANIPAMARALVACGWFGIQAWIGGDAIYQIAGALGWIDVAADKAQHMTSLGLTARQGACFLVFWLANVYFIWNGMSAIKWLESWTAPFLILAGLALLAWAIGRVGSVSALFTRGSSYKEGATFWSAFWPQLTAMVGFWATLSLNIPDFTRYARSQRSQAWGQALGLPTTMTLFCFIGIMVTSATVVLYQKAIWDPVALVSRFGSAPVIVVSLVALSVATLTTNIAANVVSPANDIANLAPSRISTRTGGMLTAVAGILMMPWYLYNNLAAYTFTWLIGYGALLGPIAGIMLCDYYALRRTRLSLRALYDPSGGGVYGRWNWAAIVALVVAVAPNVPGFVNALAGARGDPRPFPAFFDSIYAYAWFIGVGLGAAVYLALMRGRKGLIPGDA